MPVAVLDEGSAGNIDNQIFGGFSSAFGWAAVFAVFGFIDVQVAHVQKGGVLLVCPQDDASAFAAVAAVRPAEGNEFFTSKTAEPVSALAGTHFDGLFV